jgi:hypothetical protein
MRAQHADRSSRKRCSVRCTPCIWRAAGRDRVGDPRALFVRKIPAQSPFVVIADKARSHGHGSYQSDPQDPVAAGRTAPPWPCSRQMVRAHGGHETAARMAGLRSWPVLAAHRGTADAPARPGCHAERTRYDDLEFTCGIVAICAPLSSGCRAWAARMSQARHRGGWSRAGAGSCLRRAAPPRPACGGPAGRRRG